MAPGGTGKLGFSKCVCFWLLFWDYLNMLFCLTFLAFGGSFGFLLVSFEIHFGIFGFPLGFSL